MPSSSAPPRIAETSGRRELDATLVTLLVVGAALVLVGGPIAEAVAGIAPRSFGVMSAGSPYPPMAEALPIAWPRQGALVLLAVAAAMIARRPLPEIRPRTFLVLLAATVVVGFALHGFLAYPHEAFPSNARIHWVDIFSTRSEDWFYAAVKLPHTVFYDVPHVWQAINGAVNVALVGIVVARATQHRLRGLLAAAGFVGSSMMLTFATGAEDVSIGVTLLLLVLLAHGERRPVLTGFTVTLAVLGRPPFALVLVGILVGELATRSAVEPSRASTATRGFLVRVLATAAVSFAAWQLLLATRGLNWLFDDGAVVRRPALEATARPIDGFTIDAFSGAFVGHALWIWSLPVVALAAVAVVRLRCLPPRPRALVAVAMTTVAATVLLHEAVPLLYFNVRYLAYVWPLAYLAAWCATTLDHRSSTARRGASVGMAIALALAPALVVNDAFERRERRVSHPVAQLFYAKEELREIGEDRDLVTTLASPTHRNYLAYIWRRPIEQVVEVAVPCSCPDALLVTDEPPDVVDGEIVHRTDGLWVVVLGADEPAAADDTPSP